MIKRAGLTLIEVLMAIFVMGVGLLGLISLFPVAAMSMAQATQDDRATTAAANATSIAQALDLRNAFTTQYIQPDPTNTQSPWVTIDAQTFGSMLFINVPSHPIFVDPFRATGYNNFPLLAPNDMIGRVPLVAGPGSFSSPGILRRSAPYVANAGTPLKLRWFSLTDGIDFNDNGLATSPDAGVTIQREARYTWAYMLRRPRAYVASEVEMSIVVYNGRNVQLPPQELTYHLAQGSQGDTFIILSWDPNLGQSDPALRKGMWLLDASPTTGSPSDAFAVHGPMHSYFYRIVGVTPSPVQPNTIYLEVDTPLRADMTSGQAGLVIMDNVIDVFEKGTGWKP